MTVVKAHAFGNDFLLLPESQIDASVDRPALARRLCERHRGIGADGLIIFTPTPAGASMRLLNADGSRSEVSGNGVRCLAAWLAREAGAEASGRVIEIATEAGIKPLELQSREGERWVFRAAMGQPEAVRQETLPVAGAPVPVVTMRVGNPQCVVLGEVSVERLHRVGAALAVHPRFAEGTNVELATVEDVGRVRILIWERGVGPTEASGTGACAAAVAAMSFGGAGRDVQVFSPGGGQRVEWTSDGLFLTGWAELLFTADWWPGPVTGW